MNGRERRERGEGAGEVGEEAGGGVEGPGEGRQDGDVRGEESRHRPRLVTKNLQIPATFLVDGFVAGTCRIECRKKVATLTLTPFGKLLKKDLRELEQEGDALLAFVEPEAATREVTVAAS